MSDVIQANTDVMSGNIKKEVYVGDKKEKTDDGKNKEDKKKDDDKVLDVLDVKTDDKEMKDYRYKNLIDLIINNDDSLKKIGSIDDIVSIDDLLFYNEKLTNFYIQFYKGDPEIANKVITKWKTIEDTKERASEIYKELLHNIAKLQGKFDKKTLINLMNGISVSTNAEAKAKTEGKEEGEGEGEEAGGKEEGEEGEEEGEEGEEKGEEAGGKEEGEEKGGGYTAIAALRAVNNNNNYNQIGGNFKDLKDSIAKYSNINNTSNIKAIADNYGFDNIGNDNKIITPDNAFSRFINSYTNGIEKVDKDTIFKAVDDLDNDPTNPLKSLEIKYDDRIVFIAITFVIRYVTLLLIMWCIEIDTIKSFNDAFILFTFIYIVIFWFIVMIINANISQDSDENSILYSIKSVLYYFYFKINGIERLITHTVLILLLLTIPVIIKAEKKENSNEPLTYEEKIKLTNILSLFTIFMWVFTSIIATKF